MTDYDNNLTGVLFPNDRKGDNERAPDFTGTCEIEGTEYRIAGWKRVAKSSNRAFISLKLEDNAEFKARQAEALESAEGADALEI